MNWKGVLVLLLVATAINSIKGQSAQDCTDLGDVFFDNRWFYEYTASGQKLNLGFTNTTIVSYTDNVADETLDCIGYGFTNPVTLLLGAKDNQAGGRDRFCFEIASFNQEGGGLVYTLRRAPIDTPALQSQITEAIQCETVLFASSSAEFQVMIRFDVTPGAPQNGFQYALANGFTQYIPQAYDRNVPSTDELIILSEFLQTQYSKDGVIVKCEDDGASRVTLQGNTEGRFLCDPGASTYYNPLAGTSGGWRGMGNIRGTSLRLAREEGDLQIVAIFDTRWNFACVRYRNVAETDPETPRCVQYSIDLTNRDKPSCKTVNPYDNSDVSFTTAMRDSTDNAKGFISFTSCSTDCQIERCQHDSNCTQRLGSFNCGILENSEYVCPNDFEGWLCEIEEDDCDPNPCHNDQQCEQDGTGFRCICAAGFKHGTNNLCEETTCIIPLDWRNILFHYLYDGSVSDANQENVVFPSFDLIELATDTYDCERQSSTGGVFTLSGFLQNSMDQRRCFQVIPHTQVIPGSTNTGDTFLLFRVGEEATHANPIPTTSCSFDIDLPFQVLIPPSPTYVSQVPFPDGQYYHVTWRWDGGADQCADDQDSTATITTNVISLGSACTGTGGPSFSPIGEDLNVVYYWDAAVMLDGNGDSNGNAFLVAVNFPGSDAPTYYCGRYLYTDDVATPTIHMSLNLNNELAPECLQNGNSQEIGVGENHLYLKLESHRCYLTGACEPGGTCVDSPNQGVTCQCDAGYQLDATGTRCEDINECDPSPCNAEGTLTCRNLVNAFECVCKEGWDHDTSASQELCQLRDPCHNHECRNNGACVPASGVIVNGVDRLYRCQCVTGWENGNLQVCETDTNECLSNPCFNDGVCHQDFLEADGTLSFRINYYRCVCPDGFSGNRCQDERNNCFPDPCMNGGICVNYPDKARDAPGYYCDCTATTHIWQHCEHENECVTEGCEWENTVRCEDRLDERVCFCKDGYIGGETEDKHFNGDCSQVDTSNPCHTGPCENGGVCHQDGDGFRCECTDQFVGLTCADRKETCADNPCPDGIACTDVANATIAFRCNCPDHLTGVRCENDDDDFGIVEQALVGLLCALVLGCIILAIWAICANKCGPCGPKGGCCP